VSANPSTISVGLEVVLELIFCLPWASGSSVPDASARATHGADVGSPPSLGSGYGFAPATEPTDPEEPAFPSSPRTPPLPRAGGALSPSRGGRSAV